MGKEIRQSKLRAKQPAAPDGVVDWLHHWHLNALATAERFKQLHTTHPNAYTTNQWWYWRDVAAGIKWLMYLASATKGKKERKPR